MTLPGDPPERDELDHRLEAGLRRLTEPSSEPTPSRIAIIASTRATSRTFPGAQFAILIVVLAVGAVLSLQVVPGIPAASSDPVAGQTVAPPVVSNGPSPATAPSTVNVTPRIDDAWPPIIDDPVDALVADLEKAGAPVTRLESFEAGLPFGVSGLKLCVAGQQVWVYAYASADEAARVAGTIDPTDPSHIGETMIVEWQGSPRFWRRDRLLVLHLGGGQATERVLTAVLGPPFAAGRGRSTEPSTEAC